MTYRVYALNRKTRHYALVAPSQDDRPLDETHAKRLARRLRQRYHGPGLKFWITADEPSLNPVQMLPWPIVRAEMEADLQFKTVASPG